MATPRKTQSRSNQPRVSKKTVADRKQGARDAIQKNSKTSIVKKVKNVAVKTKDDILLRTSGGKYKSPSIKVGDVKNASPAYVAGYKAGLRKVGKKEDFNLKMYNVKKGKEKRGL
jgi:hypothetical protein